MTPVMIVTRPAAQGERFAREVLAAWNRPLTVLFAPLIEIVQRPVTVKTPDAVIFTSANGVTAAAGLGLPQGLRAWCVGQKTAEAARRAGFDVIAGPGDAAGLVVQIVAAHPRGQLVHVRGQHARGDICAQLTTAGILCQDVVAYEQRALALTDGAKAALSDANRVILPLFSARTAHILWKQAPFTAKVQPIAISKAVAATVPKAYAQNVILAHRPDRAAMVAAVLSALRG